MDAIGRLDYHYTRVYEITFDNVGENNHINHLVNRTIHIRTKVNNVTRRINNYKLIGERDGKHVNKDVVRSVMSDKRTVYKKYGDMSYDLKSFSQGTLSYNGQVFYTYDTRTNVSFETDDEPNTRLTC